MTAGEMRLRHGQLTTSLRRPGSDSFVGVGSAGARSLRRSRRRSLLGRGSCTILSVRSLGGSRLSWEEGRVAQTFVRELARNLPLPPDAKLVATVRSVQIVGVFLCIITDGDLVKCQCFIDLALAETKARVKRILVAGIADWAGLAAFAPKDSSAIAA